ncbi:putative RNA-directed DNA polymerase, partial [Aphis craccivora]
ISCRAFNTLGFVIRTSKNFKLTSSLKTLYCSLTTTDSSHLEQVQRRFLSFAANILGIQHIKHDYLPVSNKLGLMSLVDRRMTANLVFLSKLINGYIDAPSLLPQVNFRVPPRFSRSRFPFVIPFHHTNYGKNNPIDRM